MNNYKIFLVRSFFICIALLIAYYHICINFPIFSSEIIWIHNCLDKKISLANNLKGGKILILSGSNGLFGVNAQEIQNQVNIPCVNMAVHVCLGNYTFYYAKKCLKKGDIAILPLEYAFYLQPTPDLYDIERSYVLKYDKDYFNSLPLSTKLKTISNISFKNYVDFIFRTPSAEEGILNNKTIILKENKDFRTLTYNSKFLGKNGDQIYNIGHIQSNSEEFTRLYLAETTRFDEKINMQEIKAFSEWCKEKGVKLYITYPNMVYHKEYQNKGYKKFFNDLNDYFLKNKINIIGDPYSALFDAKLFFDTGYHLNQDGVKIRTQRMIDLIKNNCLGDS